jgi:hypothetical protein
VGHTQIIAQFANYCSIRQTTRRVIKVVADAVVATMPASSVWLLLKRIRRYPHHARFA